MDWKSPVKISYKSGYKYQTVDSPVRLRLQDLKPDVAVKAPFASLSRKGVLTIRGHYAWDGPSGPTIDTDNFMLGSLIHDCLYELIRNEFLPHYFWRFADRELDHVNELCGMSRIRRWWVRKGLAVARGRAALPKNRKKIKELSYAFN